jgi:hypothetical protein
MENEVLRNHYKMAEDETGVLVKNSFTALAVSHNKNDIILTVDGG